MSKLWGNVRKNWVLYLFMLPAILYMLIFVYQPMYGVIIAFKKFKPSLGIMGSPWANNSGFEHFLRFFSLDKFWPLIGNTIILSFYSLLAGFPIPIILALLLNSSKRGRLKKVTQTITYAPHFISVVIVVSMISILFSPTSGVISQMLNGLGILDGPLTLLIDEKSFRHLYVWTGVWQSMGWNSIIYMAVLASVPMELHEAAIVDGASRFQRLLKIDFPVIIPTMTILLILNMGSIMSVGFEKAFLMQNSLNIGRSEIISTYVYKMGLEQGQYSFSAAVGLFNSVVNLIFLLILNKAAKKLSDTSLF